MYPSSFLSSVSSCTASLVTAAIVIAGCSSSSSDGVAPNGNGVDDVKQSCEIRATWQNRNVQKCIDCLVASPGVSCDCPEYKDFGGACKAQGDAAETACTFDVKKCVGACAATDCACIDGCYAAVEGCTAKAAAREGCVTEVCSPYCK